MCVWLFMAQVLECLVDSWLLQVSSLDNLRVDLFGLESLNTETLPHIPMLTELTLDVGSLDTLPPRLLSNLPNLARLHIQQSPNGHDIDAPFELPDGLLVDTTKLVDLSLELPSRLYHVPPGLLRSVPNLKRLRLHGLRLTTLPLGWLENQNQLTDLSIEFCDLENFPEGFLANTPHMRTLFLGTQSYNCNRGVDQPVPQYLPANFLSHTPELTHVWLGFWQLETLPQHFWPMYPNCSI